MKFHYYQETDSQEMAEGIVLDFDKAGKLVGIDIQDASKNVELSSLEAHEVPLKRTSIH